MTLDGPHLRDAGDYGAGVVGALEEGVWGRNLAKVSPPLARRHQIPHPPPGYAPRT